MELGQEARGGGGEGGEREGPGCAIGGPGGENSDVCLGVEKNEAGGPGERTPIGDFPASLEELMLVCVQSR